MKKRCPFDKSACIEDACMAWTPEITLPEEYTRALKEIDGLTNLVAQSGYYKDGKIMPHCIFLQR